MAQPNQKPAPSSGGMFDFLRRIRGRQDQLDEIEKDLNAPEKRGPAPAQPKKPESRLPVEQTEMLPPEFVDRRLLPQPEPGLLDMLFTMKRYEELMKLINRGRRAVQGDPNNKPRGSQPQQLFRRG